MGTSLKKAETSVDGIYTLQVAKDSSSNNDSSCWADLVSMAMLSYKYYQSIIITNATIPVTTNSDIHLITVGSDLMAR